MKLSEGGVEELTRRFFVRGSMHQSKFGAAPIIQFNRGNPGDVRFPEWLRNDVLIIERILGIRFFHYAPRLYMLGHITPLEALIGEDAVAQEEVITSILTNCEARSINQDQSFFRLRKGPVACESNPNEFDSPPKQFCGRNRFDSVDHPVLYGSQDLEICIEECRVSAEDELFVGTLSPSGPLTLLDLTRVHTETGTNEFDSLDLSIQHLLLAAEHSYPACRRLAKAAHVAGYDGLIYPSYFSARRLGTEPHRTIYGISRRWLPQTRDTAKSEIIENIGLFGYPMADQKVTCTSINRLFIERAKYSLLFGPVGYESV